MEHEIDNCVVCGRSGVRISPAANMVLQFICKGCGLFGCSGFVVDTLRSDVAASGLAPYLSAHLRQESDAGRYVVLSRDSTWRPMAEAHRATGVPQKLSRLLRRLGTATTPGLDVQIDLASEAPQLDAKDGLEVQYLLRCLRDRGLIQIAPGVDALITGDGTVPCKLTADGWDALAPLGGQGRRGVGFIAMWFDPRMADAYKAMEEAIVEDCKLELPIRIDKVEHNDQITDRILAGIRGAQFVVADFTGNRHGVYFEAGYAYALGRVVIWTCQRKRLHRIHFDTRQFNHIPWETPAELREGLANRIKATVSIPAFIT